MAAREKFSLAVPAQAGPALLFSALAILLRNLGAQNLGPPGWRRGNTVIVLLWGGDMGSQAHDIPQAKVLAKEA